MNIVWVCRKFAELSPFELYAALRLRSEVFVVEQNCVFLDMDDRDQFCYHLMGSQQEQLVAYTRLVPPGVIFTEASIGRVVSSPSARRKGIGKILMQRSIATVCQLFGRISIKIGAQLYLKSFYESFGFRQISDVYLEDNIPHIYMINNNI